MTSTSAAVSGGGAEPASDASVWRSGLAWLGAHPSLAVLLLALVCRVGTAVLLNAVFHGTLFQDDSTYALLATQKARGQTGAWDPYTQALYDTTWTFSGPLALLYWLLGPSNLLGQLLSATFGAVTAGLVTRTAVEVLTTRWAVAAGAVVALLPSQVLFSSLILKDAAVWAVLAALGLTVAVLGRTTNRRVVLLVAVIAVLLFLVGHLRLHTLVAASWAAGLAAVFGVAELRVRRALAVVAVAVAIPWLLGIGPAGLGLVGDAQGTLEMRRQNNAVGADTAIVATPSASPGIQPVPDPGAAAASNLRYLPRGLEVMLLEPLHPTSNRRLQLAFAENLLWWPLLLLAMAGAWFARGRLRVLAFPILAGAAITVLYGLSEGNLGTAFRHRGEVVWSVSILAAVGAAQLAVWAGTFLRSSNPEAR